MPDAISNTSPLLYLYRITALNLWISDDIRQRVLALADEQKTDDKDKGVDESKP